MKRFIAALVLGCAGTCQAAAPGTLPDWIVSSADARAIAGQRFELVVVSLTGDAMPAELTVRIKGDIDERVVTMRAEGPALGRQRAYVGTMPVGLSGPVEIDLVGLNSSVLMLRVTARPDALRVLTGRRGEADYEPPLSEEDPMYFVAGARSGWSARFQLSFKYRLFDAVSGFGQERPWLAGFYFGYTQNSLWDLSSQSKPFRDTSYRPSLFWKWERTDEQTWIDALRAGVEHESNGTSGERSRSLNIAFLRPEWYTRRADGDVLQFTPKLYTYLDKADNPDIQNYRGYIDWRVRYDARGEWIATAMARRGTSGKGSVLIDFSKRARDLRFGPVGGYWHVQYFNGYGEDILDYNVRRKPQLRFGFAIVP
jgi:phospholipase A1/A2